jgi:hypothetical protein
MLSNIALYYPFIEFPYDSWVKTAALYWDKVGRIALPEYTIRDSDTTLRLAGELDFIKNFQPSHEEMDNVGSKFLTLLEQHRKDLVNYYHIPPDLKLARFNFGQQWPLEWFHRPERSPKQKLAYIFYSGRIMTQLSTAFIDAGIALPLKNSPNLMGIHPVLAFTYMEALAEEMAMARRFYPVTDKEFDHIAISGCTLERLSEALLTYGRMLKRGEKVFLSDPTLTEREIETHIATITLQSVLPRGIENVPTEKIIKLRKQHGNELAAFQTYLHDFVTDLDELKNIKDPSALQAHLELEYEKKIKPQLDDLKKCLRSLGMDAVTSVMNVRVALPALIASGSTYLTQAHLGFINPILVGAGAVAFSILPVIREKQKNAREAIASSPVAYLLRTEELEPVRFNRWVTWEFERFFRLE